MSRSYAHIDAGEADDAAVWTPSAVGSRASGKPF
jgi:hypothetical protein